jgi:XTP/dITP diphosphohydrolase
MQRRDVTLTDPRLPRLLVATTNAGKLREIRELLKDLPMALATLAAWPGLHHPEETGTTFEENARLKAIYYSSATGLLTVAEDSGLAIDALDGAPGVHSARFGGESATYPEKFALIDRMLSERRANGSTARFVCAVSLVHAGRVLYETRGTVEGRIASRPAGSGGFGYDPIFYYPPFGCTLAEAGDRKSEVSHRAAAFRALRAFLATHAATASATRDR